MRLIHSSPALERHASRRRASSIASLSGSVTALVTPFYKGRLDDAALGALCERQIGHGAAAVVVCGSTGEATSLSVGEQACVLRIAVGAAANQVPVIAGCCASTTEEAVIIAGAAAQNGASALLCAPPPYSRPTQHGIAAHVRAVAHAADLPVILYDVPGRVGVAIEDETVARLYESGLVVAIKDAAGNLSRPARLRALCGTRLLQYSGDDGTAAAHRAMGGHGCISVTANITPALCAQMHAAWDRADLIEFGRLRDLLAPLHRALGRESNPIPVKAALALADLCHGDMRLPLTRASNATLDELGLLLPDLIRAEEQTAGRPHLTLLQ